MIPANLIVNADDFGLDRRVSSAIAACLDEGLINSFSVYPFADPFHADLLKSILMRHPQVKVGAHLAVTGPDLADHPGHFRDFLARYATGRFPAGRVGEMWRGQIKDLQAKLGGAALSHLDSHQHLHMLPGLWDAARSLQEEFRVPRLRVPYEGILRCAGDRFPFGMALQCLARLRAQAGTGFIGFATSTRFTLDANRAGLERVLREPGSRFELMVHPALPGEGPALGPGQGNELEELRKLSDFFRVSARPRP